jgi:hypothetical protein
LRLLFDKNVPVGVRLFLAKHEVSTFVYMCSGTTSWKTAIYLGGRTLALVVLGSNIWPIVCRYREAIAATVDSIAAGSYACIEMPLPRKPAKK